MKGSTTQVVSNMTEMMAAWETYRSQIPDDVRERVSDLIFNDEEWTRAGVTKKTAMIMREIFNGTLPPVILQSIQPFMELMMANIHVQHLEQGTPQHAGRDLAMAMNGMLEDVRPKKVTVYLTSREEPEVVVLDREEVG